MAAVSCKKSSDDSSDTGPIPCDNVATFDVTVDATGKATFTDKSTGHISNWVWSFGDGTSSVEKNPVHTYTAPGSFNVILTVNNSQKTCEKIISSKVLVPISSTFTPPQTYTKKVLIEEFTGTWCGYCPDGAYRMESIIAANPGKCYGASIHDGDPMEISGLNNLFQSTFSVTGFPTGMVGRVPKPGATTAPMDRGSWAGRVTTLLAQSAKCGLAIDARVTGTDMIVNAHASFNGTLTGTHNITVYITEDDVNKGSTYSQSNYYNADASSPFYQLGNPIVGFKHNNVIVAVLTAEMGDLIPSTDLVANGHFKRHLQLSL